MTNTTNMVGNAVAQTSPAWLEDLFAAIDRRDSVAFAGFLTDDATFRFGNAPAVSGRAEIAEAVAGFFASIKALRHELLKCMSSPERLMCCGNVSYTRIDGGEVTVPFANVFDLRDGRIVDYQIYADLAPLWAPPPD